MPRFILPMALLGGCVGCSQAPADRSDALEGTGGTHATTADSGGDSRGSHGSSRAGEAGAGGLFGADGIVAGGNVAAGGGKDTGGATNVGGTRSIGGVGIGGVGIGGVGIGGVVGRGESAGFAGSMAGGRTGGASNAGGKTSTDGRFGTGGTAGSGAGRLGAGGVATGDASVGGGAAGGAAAGGSSDFSPCAGATQTLTVGNGQQYSTVQAAIHAISSSNATLVQVSVKAGKYKEQVTIDKPFVCLVGESAATTVITNALGTNIVTGGTVIVSGNDFSAANISFENTGGDGSGQAVALMAEGKRQQFRNCRFLSYQDTLYVNVGTQYFRDCYIQGDTDYIFGDATAMFQNCTMNNVAEGTAVTAPRTPENTTYGFVFLGGSLTANPTTSSVRSHHVYLGRPWGPYAAAAFLNVDMGTHIAADGWTTMSSNTLANTRFSEYQSTGDGANPTNATRAGRQLTEEQAANYTVAKVLSPWIPGYSN